MTYLREAPLGCKAALSADDPSYDLFGRGAEIYPQAPGVKTRSKGAARRASHDAAGRVAFTVTARRAKVLATLQQSENLGGLTADEVGAKLGWSELSVRPRVSELHCMALIEPTGERRRNHSGSMAAVWRPRMAGR